MPEQPPSDEHPTSPDLSADQPLPEEQTIPLTQQPDPSTADPNAGYAAPPPTQTGYAAAAASPPPPAPKQTYQFTRGLIGGAAAAVLLVGGLAGYAIGATVVSHDSPELDGPGRMQWHRAPGGGGMPQGPQGGFGGPQGEFGGPWSGPGDGQGPQGDGSEPDDGNDSNPDGDNSDSGT